MKKLVLILILGILMVSFVSFSLVLAEQNQTGQNDDDNESEEEIEDDDDLEDEVEDNETDDDSQGIGRTIRNRVKAGIYTNEEGEEIRVSEMARNKIKLRVRNASADSELEIEEEKFQNKTKLKVKLSNGRNVIIKIMPDTASETALARLRLKVCSEENNCTIVLKEVGKFGGEGNETRAAYEVQAERHFKILALFQTKAQVKAQIDAENGEVLVVKKPWWAFLASEPEEAETETG